MARPTILVAEDDPAVGRFVRGILEPGAVVHLAISAEKAKQLALELPSLDLLISDLVLPDIAGVELVHSVQKTHRGVKVLLMSGYLPHVGRAGVAFLQKPFTPAALRASVAKLLGEPSE
jgi:DNA-binding NtrC family response regulator